MKTEDRICVKMPCLLDVQNKASCVSSQQLTRSFHLMSPDVLKSKSRALAHTFYFLSWKLYFFPVKFLIASKVEVLYRLMLISFNPEFSMWVIYSCLELHSIVCQWFFKIFYFLNRFIETWRESYKYWIILLIKILKLQRFKILWACLILRIDSSTLSFARGKITQIEIFSFQISTLHRAKAFVIMELNFDKVLKSLLGNEISESWSRWTLGVCAT